MLKKIIISTTVATSLLASNSIELNINDVDLGLEAKFEIGKVSDNSEMLVGARYLKIDDKYTDITTDPSSLEDINILVKSKIKETGFTFGIGVKALYTENFITIPLGFELMYNGELEDFEYSINANVYYATQVLSMDEAEGYAEYNTYVNVNLIENAAVVVGYRRIDLTYVGVDSINYNNSGYVGFKFLF